jgi:endonuclease/exonuclease/phosphatase family metal-dependent hydrolase
MLRVVVWNVHGCVGLDRRFDPERTVRALAALEPDVALLQEVGDNRGHQPPVDQATLIADALGLTCVVGVTLKHSAYGYGQATLTRYAVAQSQTFDLSVRGREPRLCLRVVVGVGDARLATMNVHLGLGPGERRRQLGALLPLVESDEHGLLGGDFNDFPPGPVSRTLKRRLHDIGARLPRRGTFPSRWPLLRLDRLYVTQKLRPAAARVDFSEPVRWASDHLPLVADLELVV